MEFVFRLTSRTRGAPFLLRYAAATTLVALALGLGEWSFGQTPGWAFVMFYPAVVLTSTVFDRGTGIYATALSALLGTYFFLRPTPELALANHHDAVGLAVFIVTAGLIALLLEGMHAAFGRLLDAQQSLETANQRLATAERRTEALLHESMHRFRNDLQRLSSTISLQVSSSNDPAVHAALAEIQARVSALASIKSRLDATQITSEQTTLVDTSAFLSGLVEDWSASVGTKSISFTVHVQPHYVPASRAVVLGLILNELITNAIKYAFPNHAAGTIWVKFKRLNGEYNLRVEDNGVGHDPERAPEGTGLGARIIHGLTRQLGGRLEIASREDGGTVCSLVVPAVAGA